MTRLNTNGYVDGLDYTFGYYSEMNPTMAAYSLLNAGVMPPVIKNACELGFGQGVSINIHAATSKINWYGNDINSRHVEFAKKMADATGKNINLFAESFEDFCKKNELPNFDFIAMHGIWSWVSEDNRVILADFIKKKLNPGGLLYVSYNAYPGSLNFSPVREVIKTHEALEATGNPDLKARIYNALSYARDLNDLCSHNLVNSEKMRTIGQDNVNYLAHEYFNETWKPFYFREVFNVFNDLNLRYVCQANIKSNLTELQFTQDQKNFIQNQKNVLLRETTADFILNRNFRQDYWIKDSSDIDFQSSNEKLEKQSVILSMPHELVPKYIDGHRGRAELDPTLYCKMIEILSDQEVHLIGNLSNQLERHNISFNTTKAMINTLIALGAVAVVNSDQSCHERASRLNTFLLQKSLSPININHLASAITGGGVKVSKVRQLFIRAALEGLKEPDEWLEYIFNLLTSHQADGRIAPQTLEAFTEKRGELLSDATSFRSHALDLLKSHKII